MNEETLIYTVVIAIALIALLIVYIINVAFSRIMFDIFGVDKKLAFIPYYNSYRIFKEYKGRVWKKNWVVIYIILSLTLFIFILLGYSTFITLLSGIALDDESILTVLIPLIGIFVIYAIFEVIFSTIIQVILYWPIMRTKTQEWIFIVYLVLSVLPVTVISQNTTTSSVISLAVFVVSIAFLITYFSAASSIRRELKFNKVALFEKIDVNSMSKDEVILKLKARKRKLVYENNDGNIEEQSVVDKIEYI